MIAPDIIAEFISLTDHQLYILQNADRTFSALVNNIREILEVCENTEFEEVIKILYPWLYCLTTTIRNDIEAFNNHREHLVGWYNNGLLGADD